MAVYDGAFFIIDAFVFPQVVVVDILNEERGNLLY
jgi:hypothetical protein